VLNKCDLVRPKGRLLPLLEAWRGAYPFAELVSVSAATRDQLDQVARERLAATRS